MCFTHATSRTKVPRTLILGYSNLRYQLYAQLIVRLFGTVVVLLKQTKKV